MDEKKIYFKKIEMKKSILVSLFSIEKQTKVKKDLFTKPKQK